MAIDGVSRGALIRHGRDLGKLCREIKAWDPVASAALEDARAELDAVVKKVSAFRAATFGEMQGILEKRKPKSSKRPPTEADLLRPRHAPKLIDTLEEWAEAVHSEKPLPPHWPAPKISIRRVPQDARHVDKDALLDLADSVNNHIFEFSQIAGPTVQGKAQFAGMLFGAAMDAITLLPGDTAEKLAKWGGRKWRDQNIALVCLDNEYNPAGEDLDEGWYELTRTQGFWEKFPRQIYVLAAGCSLRPEASC